MEQLKFYNFKTRQPFTSSEYTIEQRGNRRFAVCIKDGVKCQRLVGKEQIEQAE